MTRPIKRFWDIFLFLALPTFSLHGQQVNRTMEMLPQTTLVGPQDIFMVTTGMVGTARSTRGINTSNLLQNLAQLPNWPGLVGAGGGSNVNISLAVPAGLSVFGSPLVNSGTFGFTANHVGGFFQNDGAGLTSWSFDGSTLINLNASALSSGTLNSARLPAAATLQGNIFNGPSQLLQLDSLDRVPALDGSLIFNLNAGNITSGTLPTAAVPAFSGDATSPGGSAVITFDTVNGSPGTYGDGTHVGQFTVNGKGLGTGALNVPIDYTAATNYANSLAPRTYFAATNGSSSNSGLSRQAPWPFGYALNNAGTNSTIILMDGRYVGGVYQFGANASHMTIKADHKWQAILADSSGYFLELTNTDSSCNFLTIDGLRLTNSLHDAILLRSGTNHTVRNCWVQYTGATYGGSGQTQSGIETLSCNNLTIENNLCEFNGTVSGDQGIYIAGTNCVVRNNLCRWNFSYGIQLQPPSGQYIDHADIYGNMLYGNGSGGAKAAAGTSTDLGDQLAVYNQSGGAWGTNLVHDNTLIATNYSRAVVYNLMTVLQTNNIIWSTNFGVSAFTTTLLADYDLAPLPLAAAAVGPHDVITNTSLAALFVAPSSGLYWLTAQSAARAAALPGVFSYLDWFGNYQIASSDIGAYQFTSQLSADGRALDPSPAAGADYWQAPRGPQLDGNLLNNYPDAIIIRAPTNGIDATAAIQAYLDANISPKRRLKLPAGAYTINGSLHVRAGTTLEGESSSGSSSGTILNGWSLGPPIIMDGGNITLANLFISAGNIGIESSGTYGTTTYCQLQNVRVFNWNNNAASCGLFLWGSWNIDVISCQFGGDPNGDGIRMSNNVNAVVVVGGEISSCSNAVHIIGGSCNGNRINTGLENNFTAVKLENDSDATDLTGSRFEGNTFNVWASGARDLVISHSLMLCSGTNIVLRGCASATIGPNDTGCYKNVDADAATYGTMRHADYPLAYSTVADTDLSLSESSYNGTNSVITGGYAQASAGFASLANNRASLMSSNVATGTWSFTNSEPVNWQCFIGGAGACAVQGVSVNDSQLFTGNSTNILSTVILQPAEWLRITNTIAPRFTFKRF